MGRKNLIGSTFGRWNVVDKAEDHISSSGKKEPAWLCECSCENHTKKSGAAKKFNIWEFSIMRMSC